MNLFHYKLWRYLLQATNYSVFMGLVWYFSVAPAVEIRSETESFITIAFAHAGSLREPCRTLTNKELSELAQNMRTAEECPRERSPVKILASLDNEVIYDTTLEPQGLFDDGSVDVFYSGRINSGKHELKIEMDDSVRDKGFNHSLQQQVYVEPGRILLINFEKDKGFMIN